MITFQSVPKPVPILFFVLFTVLIISDTVGADFLYKNYTVKYDRGWDVLCDPYTVKKNDWVTKVFKQKGEISTEDFPEFLKIFKRINPHIKDINRIRPGQQVLIPLKKIELGTLPGQSTGNVTIPFVTISSRQKQKRFSEGVNEDKIYTVKNGDTVSIILSKRYGKVGSRAYQQALREFIKLNPRIQDLNRIYTGQQIRLPFGNQPNTNATHSDSRRTRTSRTGLFTFLSDTGKDSKKTTSPLPNIHYFLTRLAVMLDAKLLNQGVYYFPLNSGRDFTLQLSENPIMELPDGSRFVFAREDKSAPSEIAAIKSFWKKVKFVGYSPGVSQGDLVSAVVDQLDSALKVNQLKFTDNGLSVEVHGKWMFNMNIESESLSFRQFCITPISNSEERTPDAIVRYLEQRDIVLREFKNVDGSTNKLSKHEASKNKRPAAAFPISISPLASFVKDFVSALGYKYTENAAVSFPYAGIQIETVLNLISTKEGNPVFVDFGNLYGDAAEAIQKTGFKYISIRDKQRPETITLSILKALALPFKENPKILAARRPAQYNTEIEIEGILISSDGPSDILISFRPLNANVLFFLKEKGNKVIIFNR